MISNFENVLYSNNGKLYVGMSRENIRSDIDAMIFKSEKTREKAYNKQIELFNYANSLVEGENDDVISNKDIEAYNKKEKTKKILKTAGLITVGICAAVAAKVIFKKFHDINKILKAPEVLNMETGKTEKILIDNNIIQISKGGAHTDISAYNISGEEIGLARLMEDPQNMVYRTFGEIGRDSLYIDFFATSPKYRGVGKEMLKRIVQISKKSGFEGRVSLTACTGSIPPRFMSICGHRKAQDMSCAIKYKKMGFDAIMPEVDAKINQAILNGDSGLAVAKSAYGEGFKDTLSCKMELSKDAIKKYLDL